MANYSNMQAMRSLIRASLQGILRSPSAIIFTIAFPLIFILVFGFIGEGSGFSIKVAATPGSDTTNSLFTILHAVPVLKWVSKDTSDIKKMLNEGDIVATIAIQQQPEGTKPGYKITINTSPANQGNARQLQSILEGVIQKQDPEIQKRADELAQIDMHISEAPAHKKIDFILPGQLGFSLLAAGVFGTAFVFFNLRQTLVLKRFFATPVRKGIIVISEGIARMLFQLVGATVIIAIGYFAFGYTLAHGWVTFFEMLAVCAVALLIFMGFGFVISGLAKNESSIPPLSNIITLPQFLLAGTFFPIDNFPKWMQPFCNMLPLTYVNDALRKIAFDGVGLWDVRMDMLILLVWGIVIYAVAGRTFKWE